MIQQRDRLLVAHLIHPDAMHVAIFDIDGTVANIGHRLRYIRQTPPDYEAFYSPAALAKDKPITAIITVLHAMQTVMPVVMASGRPERTREATEAWLAKNRIRPDALYMRRDEDRRPDELVKQEIMWQMLFDYRVPYIVFDDRARVVAMWRRHGIKVAAVAEGNY